MEVEATEVQHRSWRTNCVEQPLARAMRSLGASVGAHPWPYLLVPLVLAGSLASGFMYLDKRDVIDLEVQYTPRGGPAKRERRIVRNLFTTDDAKRFSPSRLTTEGTFASFIIVAVSRNVSLLTRAAFAEVMKLDETLKRFGANGFSFEDLCARESSGNCSSPNPLLSILEGDPRRIEVLLPSLTFPLYQGRIFLGPFVGGELVGGQGDRRARPLLAARALRLIYFLQEDDAARLESSTIWVESFLQRIPSVLRALNFKSIQVVYFSSLSKKQEVEKLTKEVIPLVVAAYCLTIFFSIVSCSRMDVVRTKLWVAFFGVLSSGLSIISSFGLLLYCGVPFVITAANSPFLILGVGVDDMFILVSCWQQTQVRKSVQDRMADTYVEAAVSVTITTLTDVLAFYIGAASSFISIQSFCLYTGTAFVFCYIYNLTFLGAILALNGRREESNRHWLTFMKVEREPSETQGRMYNRCCIGGFIDEATGAEIEHPMNGLFRNYYAPFLTHPFVKVFVIVLYLAYLASGMYGCVLLKEGINVRHLARDNSYVIPYYDLQDDFFSEYGPQIMVVVKESIPYWDPSVRANLEKCMEAFEKNGYINKDYSQSWLRIYEQLAKRMSINLNDRDAFINNLAILFGVLPEAKWDITIKGKEILGSRFFVQTGDVSDALDQKKLLNQLRRIAKNCKSGIIVYHPAFIFFDQFNVIIENTIQNVLVASGAMLLTSLLLIPNPVCSLWVTFAIASVIVGVSGYMAFWGVNLDSISMISLVICIGFSVDYSAHISYAFVSSEKPNVNDKAIDALHRLGYPILQGAVSTVVGVFVLSVSHTYVFRTFFKIMFLVIILGIVHGLVFIPVFLTYFGIHSKFSHK